MPELLLELFSEEIPARMQARAAEDLARLLAEALAPLAPADVQTFFGPRRIALACGIGAAVPENRSAERGPRLTAPEAALAGFLRKHGVARDALREEGDFWVLEKVTPGIAAADLIARQLPALLRRFPWPKSMRWGGTSAFTWVRPLRRILCLLDGSVVRFDLRDGADDGHGLASDALSEGHRFLAPAPFAVRSAAAWLGGLRERYVIADAAERRTLIAKQLQDLAAAHALHIVEDAALLDEVTGLVEWPVPLLGRIDPAYMDLPAEVMQVSMRVNQRYFALRDAAGHVAPWFAFIANIPARDGGTAIIAGNERVLRARFADARHFWDADRTRALQSRLPALDAVTFHARLGSQGDRMRRITRLAGRIAVLIGADTAHAERAAQLAKADLVTGMVGEFPELQGVMGRYYALHDREAMEVADAIRDHYAPRGAADDVPAQPVGIAVALADKIDTLAAFFAIGEKPTGSGDPFALRRAALGVIRIIREHGLRLRLGPIIAAAAAGLPARPDGDELLGFLAERLRVQLRAEGARHDVLAAVLGLGIDDDLARLLARTDAVAALLGTDDGANLLVGYRRAANILRIEERKDGPYDAAPDADLLQLPEEVALAAALDSVAADVARLLGEERFSAAMEALATLRPKLDAFFDRVTVNDPRPELRRNRLRLLARVRAAMHLAADFSRIEG
ncbi:MAG: glycine--tRNA ligase subunit beta [Alphaproteobacteria bacterium]|nr:glycine--tRNA ligase subunit beta [Alphaproteobacteria bacterium]